MPHGGRIEPQPVELNGGLDIVGIAADTLPVIYDCQSCGACCAHKWSWPVLRRDRSDASGIPPEMVRDDYPLLRTEGPRCVALTGDVGVSTGCSIYGVRPSACRAFTAGSPLCIEAREAKGIGKQNNLELMNS
jgi:Fe-S-cluster containining protein